MDRQSSLCRHVLQSAPPLYKGGKGGSQAPFVNPSFQSAQWFPGSSSASPVAVPLLPGRTISFASPCIFPLAPSSPLPVHVHLLVERGIPIMENLDLEELARDEVHEFLFVALPLKIRGATGSMLDPIAVV